MLYLTTHSRHVIKDYSDSERGKLILKIIIHPKVYLKKIKQ